MGDWASVATVFLFLLVLLGIFGWGGHMLAVWQTQEQSREIAKKFAEIRERLKRT